MSDNLSDSILQTVEQKFRLGEVVIVVSLKRVKKIRINLYFDRFTVVFSLKT